MPALSVYIYIETIFSCNHCAFAPIVRFDKRADVERRVDSKAAWWYVYEYYTLPERQPIGGFASTYGGRRFDSLRVMYNKEGRSRLVLLYK